MNVAKSHIFTESKVVTSHILTENMLATYRVAFFSLLRADGETLFQISCEVSKYFDQFRLVQPNIYLDINFI